MAEKVGEKGHGRENIFGRRTHRDRKVWQTLSKRDSLVLSRTDH
jgi:hypothetical protein